MSFLKSISRNSFFLASSQVIEKILSFLVVILLARYLGKGDYGKLVYATAFANLLTFFWDFGLHRLILRDVAKDRSLASTIFPSRLKLQILSSLAGLGVLLGYLFLFEVRGLDRLLILIFAFSTALNHLSNSFRSIFIAFEKASYETYFNFGLRSFLLLAVFWGIQEGFGLIGISLILLFSSVLNLIGSWRLVENYFFHTGFRGRGDRLRPIVKESLPLAIIIAFTTFYFQVNKILLLKWRGEAATGIYGAADIIVMTFLIISNSLVLASFPIISRESQLDKERTFAVYKGVFKVLLTLGLPVALGGMLLSKEVISFIYGTEFSESGEVLRILIWATPLLFLTNFTGSCLIATEKQRLLAFICGCNMVLNLSLNLILIPSYGSVGAAIASLSTEGVNLIIQYQVLRHYWKASVFESSLLKILISLGLMGLFIHWAQEWNLILILSGAILLYGAGLLATGFCSLRGLSALKRARLFLNDR